MIKCTVRYFKVDKAVNWRNLNWNKRHRKLTANEIASQSRSVNYFPAPKSRLMHRSIRVVSTTV